MRTRSLAKEEAIRSIALQIIAEEGLENLTMQKLASAAKISPRTIYLKYKDKDDLLIKLFIEEVLGNYEKAVLQDFAETMSFAEGVKRLWLNAFQYFKHNKPALVLMQYGKYSPLLNKAFGERNIAEGQFFAPIHRFVKRHVASGHIRKLPFEAHRALLFAPMQDLMHEYYEHQYRPKQVISEKVILQCCEAIIQGMLQTTNK